MNATGTEQWNWDDGSGQRVMQRTSVGGTISPTVYAFGLEEHQYNASGTNTGNTSSYSVGGYLVGEQTGTSTKTTTFLLTDLLGSVVASFSNISGSAAVQGNRAYSPYGTPLYQQGSVGTSKGFTGQYADSTSGLDDDNARYYDPLVGQFVSADSVQGNLVGMDPYAYVGGNPETWTDPTGHDIGEGEPIAGGDFGPWASPDWMPYPSPTGIEGPEDVPLDAANPAQFAAESFNEEYQLIGQQAEEQQNILNAEDEQVSEEQTAALQEEEAAMGQLPGETNGTNTYPEGNQGVNNPAASNVVHDPILPNAPSSVEDAALQTAQAQNEAGGKGAGQPTMGMGVVEGTINGEDVSFSTDVISGQGKGPTHAEPQSLTAVRDWMKANVEQGDEGILDVHVITQHQPCSYYCTPNITSGRWQAMLQASADKLAGPGNITVNLYIWYHMDDGILFPYYYPWLWFL